MRLLAVALVGALLVGPAIAQFLSNYVLWDLQVTEPAYILEFVGTPPSTVSTVEDVAITLKCTRPTSGAEMVGSLWFMAEGDDLTNLVIIVPTGIGGPTPAGTYSLASGLWKFHTMFTTASLTWQYDFIIRCPDAQQLHFEIIFSDEVLT